MLSFRQCGRKNPEPFYFEELHSFSLMDALRHSASLTSQRLSQRLTASIIGFLSFFSSSLNHSPESIGPLHQNS